MNKYGCVVNTDPETFRKHRRTRETPAMTAAEATGEVLGQPPDPGRYALIAYSLFRARHRKPTKPGRHGHTSRAWRRHLVRKYIVLAKEAGLQRPVSFLTLAEERARG